MWNKSEVKGRFEQVKENVQQSIGETARVTEQKAEVEWQKLKGQAREEYRSGKRKISKAIINIGRGINN